MANHSQLLINQRYWTEKILTIYWIMVLMSFIGQCIGLTITVYYFPYYVIDFVILKLLIPTSIQLISLGITTYLVKVKKNFSDKLLVITGTISALAIIINHPEVPGLQILLMLPMAVILIYYDRKILQFSLIVNVIALTAIYLLPSIRNAVTVYEYFSYLFVLLCSYFVFLIILSRANEMLEILQRANEKEQDLLVKSTMMERLTKIDALTGLYNHKTFHEYLDFLFEQSIFYDMPLQLAIIDIDNFKSVNDQYGHSNGDLVLKRVAFAISEKVTEDDISARYGGEEFTILLTNKTLEESYRILEEVRSYIASQFHQELNGHVTVSIGLKQLEKHLSKVEFFDEADELLYKAKSNGKNQIVCDQLSLTAVE
ncbi:diguanylate cyclase (GGDEF) domain-containing protein [Gracilibacillus ureilyticus]|uniref:Diguanylate cyclase (GGDEF) domain-containing protein n=1 Tax=Gracilibacillus ureilyticus TaxID=531814 RepID=A0A1H9M676_9BACI|nr:GGDEF domain-containing protein [Gracilibacillus ureilyticus]SER19184.1 diguanylate cyclase (GGDEF) domain-containing protein [Gracilibacillus ureilyticus]